MKEENNDRVDRWLGRSGKVWPILFVIGSGLIYFGGRMENLERNKLDLIATRADFVEILQPIRSQLTEIRAHIREHEQQGHPATEERIKAIQQRLDRLERRLDEKRTP